MTVAHVAVIIAALLAVLLCGAHPSCAANMTAVADIAKMVIAGALGNAMGRHSLDALKPKRKTTKRSDAAK
jgi:lipoprotein signal peptidase